MPTQDENVLPWPLCENLSARPCSPPLCVRRPLRTPMSGAAWPEASLFPLIAPSIESSNPMVFSSVSIFGFLGDGFTKLPAGRCRNHRTRLQGGQDKNRKKDCVALASHEKAFHHSFRTV